MLSVSIIQTDIAWEDKQLNLARYEKQLESLSGKTDLAVLPEMCTTGFSMQARQLAETNEGMSITRFKQYAARYGMAIAGSFIATDGQGRYFNRGFFLSPEGGEWYYDKHHLFRMGTENQVFTPGEESLTLCYKSWNIRLIICYDLRFPVWIRNQGLTYDLLLCSANWPSSRQKIWECLLQARSFENMAYVCGVNRIGTDGAGLRHKGGSLLIDPRGKSLIKAGYDREAVRTITLRKEALEQFRRRFPAWKDADNFRLGE